MASKFSISINEVVDLLGLQRNPRCGQGSSCDVSCPFCHEKVRYHMNSRVKAAHRATAGHCFLNSAMPCILAKQR